MPLDDLVEPRVTTNEQRAKSLVRHLVSKRAWAKPTSVLEGGRSGRTIFVNQLTGVYRAREHKRPSETMKILTLPTLMTAAYFVARGDWTIADDLQLRDATGHRIATLPEKTTFRALSVKYQVYVGVHFRPPLFP
jgi:hypothetical protein